MKKITAILLLLCLASLCAGQNKKYPELINSGYSGKIYSIKIKMYRDSIKDKSADSLISVRTRYYNKDGNATKESYVSDTTSQVVEYKDKNGVRTIYYYQDEEKESRFRGEIIQQKTGHLINFYVLQDMLVSKEVFKYNERLKIKSNDRTIYAIIKQEKLQVIPSLTTIMTKRVLFQDMI
jgi:inorganic pyrophosphatase/exopolyphosphatase